MIGKDSFRLLLWLVVASAAVAIAGCRASETDPSPTAAGEDASPTPTPLVAPTEPAIEQPEKAPIPTATITATVTPAAGDIGENANQVAMPEGDLDVATGTADYSGAANANVEFVRATLESGGTWRFDVTVRHPDTGWEDYADGWDVVTPDGQVLKASDGDPFTRLLLHPHENEQPFTRSQGGIVVPEGVTVVIVRAHDLVEGFGGREVRVDLLSDGGPDYEVIRE